MERENAPTTAACVPSAARIGPRRNDCTACDQGAPAGVVRHGTHARLSRRLCGWGGTVPSCTHVLEQQVVSITQILAAHTSQQVLDLRRAQSRGADHQRLAKLGTSGNDSGRCLEHAARAEGHTQRRRVSCQPRKLAICQDVENEKPRVRSGREATWDPRGVGDPGLWVQ